MEKATENSVHFSDERIVSEIGTFKLVRASELSVNDDFLNWEPQTWSQNWEVMTIKQQKLKEQILQVINEGIENFYRPDCDPSIDRNGKIVFVKGAEPAMERKFNWWKSAIEKMNQISDLKFRIGGKKEYIIFLAYLMKQLLYDGWDKKEIWYAVSVDSWKLAHYRPVNAVRVDLTGSKEICGWSDLGNTHKMLSADDDEDTLYWIAGACYELGRLKWRDPVASCIRITRYDYDDEYRKVPWIVLPK